MLGTPQAAAAGGEDSYKEAALKKCRLAFNLFRTANCTDGDEIEADLSGRELDSLTCEISHCAAMPHDGLYCHYHDFYTTNLITMTVIVVAFQNYLIAPNAFTCLQFRVPKANFAPSSLTALTARAMANAEQQTKRFVIS